METLRTADGRDLPPCLKNEIKRECRRLWQVIEMIMEGGAEQRQAAETTAPGIAQLSHLRGIGLTIASVMMNEVFFRDFQNRREVAGYLGLASSPWSSGAVSRDQGIQRSGNPRARRTAIELGWLWLRHQPDSGLARWFHERVGAGKGRIRRTMIVALARKLIIALWRYLTQGPLPEGTMTRPDERVRREGGQRHLRRSGMDVDRRPPGLLTPSKRWVPSFPASPNLPVNAGYGCRLHPSRPDMR
ncbi:transposase [Mesorhizobium sp. M1227]|uniref:transposase n=1 Tax=Mesorhizobium sp. M1227 TaxID=2957071 RepID=UPI00333D968E